MSRASDRGTATAGEAEFLDGQAALACAAMATLTRRFTHGLTSGAKRATVERFPLAAIGGAAAAGIAAGMALAKLRQRRGPDGDDLTAAAGVAPAGLEAAGPPLGDSWLDHLGRLARAIGLG